MNSCTCAPGYNLKGSMLSQPQVSLASVNSSVMNAWVRSIDSRVSPGWPMMMFVAQLRP